MPGDSLATLFAFDVPRGQSFLDIHLANPPALAMRIKLTVPNSIALAALSFFMQESHELAHTSVGRLLCGCWGRRNFNLWGLCADCVRSEPITLLATLAGPFYSFTMIWIGYYLLTKASARTKSFGLALVISSMPFSRVLTPIFGGGDEIFALTRFGMNHTLAWVLTLIVVFALAVPPMVRIYRTIENRRKVLWIIGLLLVPFLMIGAVVFALLQGFVLGNGILADDWVLGSPMIVTLWVLTCVAVVIVFGRHLGTLLTGQRCA